MGPASQGAIRLIPAFQRFAAIDWSGAKGLRHRGIAVALCDAGTAAPRLIAPPAGALWSRSAVANWLIRESAVAPTLFGFDFSFAPPLIARGSYLPGETVPDNAPAFWAYVDRICDDADLGAASLLEIAHRPHFYFGKADGVKADFLHKRRCDDRYAAIGGGKLSTVYDAIGAAQVAKASFAGMRMLHHLHGKVPVWPFDPLPQTGSLVVEIYTSIAARAAGRPRGRSKMRDRTALDMALRAMDTDAYEGPEADDHQADALLTAAWMRAVASDPRYWTPPGLDPHIARTEGWTFGVL